MDAQGPASLGELVGRRDARPAWHLDLVLPEIGGGRFALGDLSRIDEAPQATSLRVSGLDQRTFEALVTRYGSRFRGLYFWKCPRIEDLSPLEDLPQMTHVAYYWNQRATKLWDLSETPQLRGLQFEDFTRLHQLDDLSNATSLEELSFGDKVWVKAVFTSLAPLADLVGLRTLSFTARRIDDGRVQPLAQLQRLERLQCSSNLFTTEQLAWLRARLPQSVQGRVLAPVMRMDKPLPSSTGAPPKDVLVVGKRKPWLNSTADAARIERYEASYWRLVDKFREHPDLEPDPVG